MRDFTGWAVLKVSPYNRYVGELLSPRDIHEEIFSEMTAIKRDYCMFLEISKRHKTKTKQRKTSWKKFGQHVSQAEDYYLNASKIRSASASLFYYYSFLNLVGAYFALQNQTITEKIHGINFKGNPKKIEDISLKIKEGVLSYYYKNVTKNKVPFSMELRLTDLLRYCSDISYQNVRSGYGERYTHPCKVRLMVHAPTGNQWQLVAIPNTIDLARIQSANSNFSDIFSKILINETNRDKIKNQARELFDFDNWVFPRFDYWEQNTVLNDSENPRISSYANILFKDLDIFAEEVTTDEFDCTLSEPVLNLKNNRNYVMKEDVAIYIIMYIFGHLVRYDPDKLSALSYGKSGWIIESFVQSCPLKFLRIMRNRIMQDTAIYK